MCTVPFCQPELPSALVSRTEQDQLIRWVIAAHDAAPGEAPPLPSMLLDRFAAAGLATGLTALIGALAEYHSMSVPAEWSELVTDQRHEVAERQRRFVDLLPVVLRVLNAANVPAIPVKGAVLTVDVWKFPAARPMADIDLIVAPYDRARAQAAFAAAGVALRQSTPWEDTYLGWGDGSIGRTDGESAAHNGKIEIHPGWVERLHNYLVDDGGRVTSISQLGSLGGQPCHLLSSGALAIQALGHLSACAIRAEVRAVNILDVILAVGRLDEWERSVFNGLVGDLDGRLTAPGLWLVERYRPGTIESDVTSLALRRIGRGAADRLVTSQPSDVLRAFGTRTTAGWRLAFAQTPRERLGVLRQLIRPAEEGLGTRVRRGLRGRPG
jgi:Uncharacterised nucleotidyltransferase